MSTPAQIGPANISISFQGDIACGGSATLILNQNGTCSFRGSFHDSGLVPYNVALVMVVVTRNTNKAFTFVKSGTVHGTADIIANPSNTRDFTWNDTPTNADVAANWNDLVTAADLQWKADVHISASDLLSALVSIGKTIISVV